MAVGSSSGPPPTIAAGSVPAGPASHAQNIGEVVVEHVPDRLAQLPRTIILTGMISAQQEGGAVILKTQVGELTIRSPIALPTDKILAIQIPPGAPPVRATISIMSVGPAALVEAPPTVQVVQPAILPNQTAPSATPTGSAPATGLASNTALLTPSRTAALSAQMALLPLLEGSVVEAKIHALPVPGVMPSPLLTPTATPATPLGTAPPTLPLLAGFFKGPQGSTTTQTTSQVPTSPPPSLLGLLSGKAPTPTPQTQTITPPTTQPATPLSTAPSTLAAFGSKALATLTPSTLGPMVSGLSDAGALRPTPAPTVPLSGATTSAPPPPSFATAFMSATAMAEPAFQSLPSLLALPPGSVATFQVDSIALPQSVAPPASPPAPPPAAPSAPPPAATASAATTTTPAPPQAAAPTRPLMPPAAMAPAAPQAPPPPDTAFSAIVVGRAPQGQALATSPLGLLVLDTKADLPVGTRVTLSVLHVEEPPALPDAAPSTPATPKDWPALQSLVSVLPAEARPFVHMARPQTFGASVLFMLTALRFGDMRALVKDDVLQAARESGAEDLISRVMGELSQATQNWQKPEALADPAAWRSLALPLWSDGGASRLALHVRREPDPEQEDGDARAWGQRLVVEVNLSRLGPLLLDGFILAKRFALTLRSQRKLPASLQTEIQTAFDASLGAAGWSGRLSFETAADIWLGKRQR